MKLKIRDEEEREPNCEFWLEEDGDELILKSQKGDGFSLSEFRIRPDGNWEKVLGGNLNDIQKRLE